MMGRRLKLPAKNKQKQSEELIKRGKAYNNYKGTGSTVKKAGADKGANGFTESTLMKPNK